MRELRRTQAPNASRGRAIVLPGSLLNGTREIDRHRRRRRGRAPSWRVDGGRALACRHCARIYEWTRCMLGASPQLPRRSRPRSLGQSTVLHVPRYASGSAYETAVGGFRKDVGGTLRRMTCVMQLAEATGKRQSIRLLVYVVVINSTMFHCFSACGRGPRAHTVPRWVRNKRRHLSYGVSGYNLGRAA